MYNDMYNTFSDETFEYSYPFSFKSQNQPYLEMIDKAEEVWDYNYDNIWEEKILKFKLDRDISDDEIVKLTIYNFRYEKVLDKYSSEINNNYICYKLSPEELILLVPNIYFYSLEVYKKTELLQEVDSTHFLYVK